LSRPSCSGPVDSIRTASCSSQPRCSGRGMRLAGASSGVENPAGKGAGIVGVCDRAGRRSVTKLQRKVAVTGESLPRCAAAAELWPSPCVKAELRGQSSPRSVRRPRRPIRIARRRLFHDRRVRFASQTTRRASPLLVPGPPLTHPGFRTRHQRHARNRNNVRGELHLVAGRQRQLVLGRLAGLELAPALQLR